MTNDEQRTVFWFWRSWLHSRSYHVFSLSRNSLVVWFDFVIPSLLFRELANLSDVYRAESCRFPFSGDGGRERVRSPARIPFFCKGESSYRPPTEAQRHILDCTQSKVATSVIDERFRARLVESCVPVSVERLGKDQDADENVDADQSTGRPVKGGQSIGLFTQREETDIDFRVSGLPHAVVKQAKNFRVRELVKTIESHPHWEALQADLQQNNVYNPFSDDSKAMTRVMGNVELLELCGTLPKVQCSECLIYWS